MQAALCVFVRVRARSSRNGDDPSACAEWPRIRASLIVVASLRALSLARLRTAIILELAELMVPTG